MSAPRFQMGDDELVVSFKQAKDKRAQIYVLSDLNCVSPYAVAERLQELGALDGTKIRPGSFSNVYTPVKAAPSAKPRPVAKRKQPEKRPLGRPSDWDHELAEFLLAEGKSDAEIAEQCKCSPYTIRNWRHKNGKLRTAPHTPPKRKAGDKPMTKEIKDETPAGEWPETEQEQPAETAPAAAREDAPLEPAAEAPARYTAPVPEEKPEAVKKDEDRTLTLGEFRRALSAYLPVVLNEAELYIDGEPILDLYGFSVTTPDGVQVVDLLTRRGAKGRA